MTLCIDRLWLLILLPMVYAHHRLHLLHTDGATSPLLAHGLGFGALQHPRFWRTFDPHYLRVRNLLKALGPTMLRVGGSETEFVTFCPHCQPAKVSRNYQRSNFTDYNLTTVDVDNIFLLAEELDAQLLIDINVKKRDLKNDFDPSNLEQLLDYFKTKNHRDVWFQLGNEPNAYRKKLHMYLSPAQLAHDYSILQSALNRNGFSRSLVFGPEVTSGKLVIDGELGIHPIKFMSDFLAAGGGALVNCVSWHHYYVNGKNAYISLFTDLDVLESFKEMVLDFRHQLTKWHVKKPMCLTETGSAWGGGAYNLSDRYVSGFMLVDKLGLSGLQGVVKVTRQELVHGHYSLISQDLSPNPDYWISVLYSRLVKHSGRVFEVNCPSCSRLNRLYAHEAADDRSLVIMALNLDRKNYFQASLSGNYSYESYCLSPDRGDLLTQRVLLNGRMLAVSEEGNLPPLVSKKQQSIRLEPLTYGFFIVKDYLVNYY